MRPARPRRRAVGFVDPSLVDALDRGFREGGYTAAMKRAAAVASSPSRPFDWLEKGCETRDPNMGQLGVSPIHDSLRSEPRFQALLRRVGLPEG